MTTASHRYDRVEPTGMLRGWWQTGTPREAPQYLGGWMRLDVWTYAATGGHGGQYTRVLNEHDNGDINESGGNERDPHCIYCCNGDQHSRALHGSALMLAFERGLCDCHLGKAA